MIEDCEEKIPAAKQWKIGYELMIFISSSFCFKKKTFNVKEMKITLIVMTIIRSHNWEEVDKDDDTRSVPIVIRF